jgi:hypothetical protein
VVDLRPVLVSPHKTARVPSEDGPTGSIAGTPAPNLRALLLNDGPAVRPGTSTTTSPPTESPMTPLLPRRASLHRVVQGRWVEGGLREDLTVRPVPLVPQELAR